MEAFEADIDAEAGTIAFWHASYGFAWSWSGRGHGTASLWAGDPNGPSFLEDEFTVQVTDGRPWVEWSNAKGQSGWRPDKDEDEDDYAPKPEGEVGGAGAADPPGGRTDPLRGENSWGGSWRRRAATGRGRSKSGQPTR